MSWISLVLPLLRLVLMFQTWARERELMDAGQDRAIAQAALQVLEATKEGKALRERIKSLTDAEEEDVWNRMLRG